MLKMLSAMDGSASALQSKSLFGGLIVVSSTPMCMPHVAGTTLSLLKTFIPDF